MKKTARQLYLVIASLFLLSIVSQVYFVGLTMVANQPSMDKHINFGQLLGVPTLLLIALAYLGRMSASMKRLSWLSFIVFTTMVMILFLRNSVAFVAALHPILALVLFGIAVSMEVGAWKAAREPLENTAAGISQYGALKQSN